MPTYYTQGLPNGTHKEIKYEFSITQNNPREGETENIYSIFIPGNYIGRDQTGDPTFPEQVAWLNSLFPKYKIKEVWFGTWEIVGKEDYIAIINFLTTL
jgi:hypothetical protein